MLNLLLIQLVLSIAMKIFSSDKEGVGFNANAIPYQIGFIIDFILSITILIGLDRIEISVIVVLRMIVLSLLKVLYRDFQRSKIMNASIVLSLSSVALILLQ